MWKENATQLLRRLCYLQEALKYLIEQLESAIEEDNEIAYLAVLETVTRK